MKETAIRVEIGNLRLSAVLFDEAFYLHSGEKTAPSPAPSHRHADFEIFFLLRGSMTVTDARETVKAEENRVLILPPLHNHVTETKVLRGFCFYFQTEKIPRRQGDCYERISEAIRDRIRLLDLSEAGRFYVEQLAKTVAAPSPVREEEHLTALLFTEIFRPFLPAEKEKGNKNLRYINGIDLFIAEHYREKIRLTDLSRVLYLCPKQITRIIRKKYGCSLSELVKHYRMSQARALLIGSEASVATVAEAVGYEYPNCFHAHFRQLYGETPGEYRERMKKSEPRS